MAHTVPAQFLGMMISGDVDGLTIYTNRYGRKVSYKKAPPLKPASVLQALQRGRFRDAMTNWRNATTDVKIAWEQASLRSSICMTGLNLWLHFSLKGRPQALITFSLQTGVPLSMPPTV